MPDDSLAGLSSSQRKILRVVQAQTKKLVAEEFAKVGKDVMTSLNTKIDDGLLLLREGVDEALRSTRR
jgi:hypothetical protein